MSKFNCRSGLGCLFLIVPFAFLAPVTLGACSQGAEDTPDSGRVTLGDLPAPGTGSLPVGETPSKPRVDGGFPTDAGVLPASRFASRVVEVKLGDCAGFGLAAMPDVVLGPPEGGGDTQGSLDVLSLGVGGSISLSFEADPIVDGPGTDFLVFENAFFAGGNPLKPFAELATVSVSDDGVTWSTFPCTALATDPAPYGACAGWHPVRSASSNGVSPFDPEKAGGDPFDLADLGVKRARFVRIVDRGLGECPKSPAEKVSTVGFDLDAVASVHHEKN